MKNRQQGLGEQSIGPIEEGKPDDLFVACVSFEPRCTYAASILEEDTYRARSVLLLRYHGDGEQKDKSEHELLGYLKNANTREGPRASALQDWVECFSDREKEELLQELLESIDGALSSGDWSPVREVVESWEETAEILSDEQLMAEIEEAREDIKEGNVLDMDNREILVTNVGHRKNIYDR